MKQKQVKTLSDNSFDFFESVIESSPISIIAINKKGKISLWNKAAVKTFGWEKDEIIGRSNPLIPDDHLTEYKDKFGKVIQGAELIDFRTKRKHKDGCLIDVSISTSVWRDHEGNIIGGIAQIIDIAERLLNQKRIEESETRYRGLFNSIRDAILVTDTDRNIINCNPAFTEMFGYYLNDLKGKKTITIYENEEQFLEFGKALKEHFGEDRFLCTVNFKRKDGSVFPGEIGVFYLKDTEGNIKGFIGLIRDVSSKIKAESDLKESEEKFKNIFEENFAPMMLLEPDSRNIVDVNSAAVKYYGWSREEFLKMKIDEINTLPSDEIIEEMGNAKNLNRTHFEFRHRRADGSARDVEVFGSKIKIKNKDYLHSIVHDITERKLAEEALRESKENLSITLHSIGDGVISTDVEGKVVLMNPVAEKLCGWKFENARGKLLAEVFKIINAETRKTVKNPVSLVMETGERIGLANHTVLISKDGKEYQVADSAAPIKDSQGKISGVVLVFTDVTEDYIIREALKESEEKYREFFMGDLTGDFLSTVDGKMIECNPAFLKIMGYDSLEDVNRGSLFMFYKNKNDRNKLVKLIEENKEVSNYELSLIKKDGEEIFVIENVVGIFDEKGELTHLRGYIFDITDGKIAEEKNKQAHSLLYSIRNINQLIVTEKDMDVLCQRSCELLMESRGYCTVWIGLTKDNGGYDKFYSVNAGNEFEEFAAQAKIDGQPKCLSKLSPENPIIRNDDVEDYCTNCIMLQRRSGYGIVALLIRHLSNTYGVLYIIMENIYLHSEEEESLLLEVADDLGLAIYLQKESLKRTEAEARFKSITQSANDAIVSVDDKGIIIGWNSGAEKIFGYRESETINMPLKIIIPINYFERHNAGMQRSYRR